MNIRTELTPELAYRLDMASYWLGLRERPSAEGLSEEYIKYVEVVSRETAESYMDILPNTFLKNNLK